MKNTKHDNKLQSIVTIAQKYNVNIYNDEKFIKKIENVSQNPYNELHFAKVAKLFLWIIESEESSQKSK